MTNNKGRPPKYLVEQLTKIQSDVQAIRQVLKGYNGDKGLCEQVENNSKAINKIWLVLAVMGVSIGGGAWAVVKTLIGG